MIIAKNDEAKRSKIWRIVTLVSSVLIIVIAIFLLTKLFTANPLEGTWLQDESDMTLEIRGKDTAVLTSSGRRQKPQAVNKEQWNDRRECSGGG